MNIHIAETTTIREIQKIFQNSFPYLKIEFSDKSHEFGEPTNHGHWYDPCFRLLDIAHKKDGGYIQINPWNSTGATEQDFADLFGVYPQIFRMDKGHWIETAGTDIISLYEQNEIGKQNFTSKPLVLWVERECLL
jgi:hypothetical protein